MKLGERIQTWRKSLDLTQQDLAKVCKISVSAVSYWETGTNHPSQKHLERIVRRFGVTMERFYGELPALPEVKAKAS